MPKHIWIVNFEEYNPPNKTLHSENRGKALSWVRLQADWYDDPAIAAMAEEGRWIWPAMLALAGKSVPPGRIDMTIDELSRELRTTRDRASKALDTLWKRGRIRYGRVAARHPSGGGTPPAGKDQGGYVRTYLRTNERTRDDGSKEPLGTTKRDEVARLTRLLGDVTDPMMRSTLERKLARLTA